MTRVSAYAGAFLAMAALLGGCSAGAPEDAEAVGAAQAPIIYGAPSGTEHDSVVLLVIRKDGVVQGECTGTLVAPNLVLTARHCVSETDEGALCRVDGSPYEGGLLGADFAADELFVYTGSSAISYADDTNVAAARGKKLFFETTSTYCDKDIAFLLLDKSVPGPVAPMRLKEGARQGETLTAVGWGLTERGSQPSKRLMRDGMRVEAVGPLVLDEATEIGLSRSEFLVGEGTCSGDSGGPTFASTGAVVGVVSRGGGGDVDPQNRASKCVGSNVIGIYTHLATKKALVDRAFAASGFAPRDEGTPPGKATGGSCRKNVDCSSNACIDGTCMSRCGEGDTCGDEEVCATREDIKVCVAKPETPADETPGDKTATAAAPSSSTTTTTTSGCSAAPRSASPPSALVLGLVAALLARARRRPRA